MDKWLVQSACPGFRHPTGSTFTRQETEMARLSNRRLACLYFVHVTSFLSSDIPGGFSVRQREEPQEGGDLHLTCAANKYLYSVLSWQLVNDTKTAQSWSSNQSTLQFTSGRFSNTLDLSLGNLTARNSGTYRCSARHIVTGQEIHLDVQVMVTSKLPSQFIFKTQVNVLHFGDDFHKINTFVLLALVFSKE